MKVLTHSLIDTSPSAACILRAQRRNHKTAAVSHRKATPKAPISRALSHQNRQSTHSTHPDAYHPSKYLTMDNYNYDQASALQDAISNKKPGVNPALHKPDMDQLENENAVSKGGAAAAIPNLVAAPFKAGVPPPSFHWARQYFFYIWLIPLFPRRLLMPTASEAKQLHHRAPTPPPTRCLASTARVDCAFRCRPPASSGTVQILLVAWRQTRSISKMLSTTILQPPTLRALEFLQ